MALPIAHDFSRNVTTLGGCDLVFHCHFYNCALQRAIEAGMGSTARDVLRAGSAAPIRAQLLTLAKVDATPIVELASDIFRQLGFGTLDLSGVGDDGGLAVVENSHYAMGWSALHGPRDEPVCRFVEGFITGSIAAGMGCEPSQVIVNERACFVCGAERCEFVVEVRR